MSLKVVKSVCIALLLFASGIVKGQGLPAVSEKSMAVAMRMIGHQLLLESGDSTSRVLPVEKEETSYRILFENDFALRPTDLIEIVDQMIYESGIANAFVVEVEDCDSNKVVYAYKISNTTNSDIIPCAGRDLPEGCYSLLITLNDQVLMLAETEISQPAEGAKSESNVPFWMFSVVTVIVAVAVYRRRKRNTPVVKNPNLISLGKYHFDKLNAELIIEEQRIVLTSKEADLLVLLYETVNTTVERDVLLNKVWGDEGDYIGRTLDVFISKLRKKLEFDAEVKIVNVRGVGYKLVMAV